ncbi:MAG TPA: hypothetical protein PLZ84_06770 [Clostridia bacterium]|nr:hypothetical protein [Clostridia bacterium]
MKNRMIAGIIVGTIAGMAAGITMAKGLDNFQTAQRWMKRGKRMFRTFMRNM